MSETSSLQACVSFEPAARQS